MVANIEQFNAPTEMDHAQIRRVMDIYVRPQSEDLGRVGKDIQAIVDSANPRTVSRSRSPAASPR